MLALLAALTASSLQPGPSASAADLRQGPVATSAADDVAVVLDDVDPVVVTPGEAVTLTGRLINRGETSHRVTSLGASVSSTGLTSRRQVSQWLDDGRDLDGPVLALGDDDVGPVVAPSQAVPFQVEVPPEVTEDLPSAAQVLPLVISAGEDGEAQEGAGPVRLRTTLVSAGTEEIQTPLDTSWVVPLTLPPDPDLLSPVEEVHAAAWLSAIGEDSAVTGWLDDLLLPGVTYVVDPAALVGLRPAPPLFTPEAAQDTDPTEGDPAPTPAPEGTTATPSAPADAGSATGTVPAPVPDDDASTQSATPEPTEDEPTTPATAADVEQALGTLRTRLAGLPDDQVWWLPSNDPDLVQLTRHAVPPAQAGGLLATSPVGATDTLAPLLGTGRHDVAWPLAPSPSGDLMTRMVELVDSAREQDGTGEDLGVVILPRESFTADSAAMPRRGAIPLQEADGVTALGVDSWTSALVAQSQDVAELRGSGAAAQQLLAHTLGTYLEAPGDPRELVVAPPRPSPAPPEVLGQLSEGWRAAPWLRPVSAQDLVEGAQGSEALRLTGEAPQEAVLGDLVDLLGPGQSPLTDERAAALGTTAQELDDLEGVLRDTTATQSWRSVLSALWSGRWRSEETGWTTARSVLREDVGSTREGVAVRPSTVNFLTDQGEINITVVNELGVALDDLVLEVVASNGRLQVIRQPDPVSIGADSRASVSFEARSITRGETELTATLSTPGGTTLGEPVPIDVRVQPTGIWVYWVLGGLAGLVLVLGLARAVRQGPRVSAPAAAPTGGSADEEGR
ncbi:hypothetical protein SGUI_1886 [Serinicoccus hydrothermalis]|uniref:Secreted protein n=1 Tax=Serinicoccus hydrothermalis TaxID=1758689 RepID=A0A1B1NCX4_9MICO|nr:hypothetical protein SGUI_1886 [Serinicoccus hydrothermalis]